MYKNKIQYNSGDEVLSLHQCTIMQKYLEIHGDRGSTVVKVLCYKSEGHWFDPS